MAKREHSSRRLLTVPGIVPLVATALTAAIGNGSGLAKARDLAAWLRLVPRQRSTIVCGMEIYQVFGRCCADFFEKRFAPLSLVLGVAFGGVERLLFSRNPSCFNNYHKRPLLNRTCLYQVTVSVSIQQT
jgi:hypothetical protein